MDTYFDSTGACIQTSALLASGGEGDVYTSTGRDDELLKVYRRRGDAGDAPHRAKLEAMLTMSELAADRRLAWPQRLLFDAQGAFRGFAMRRVAGRSLVALSARQLRTRAFPTWTKAHLCQVVYDVAQGCEFLAERGVLPGDISLTNFLVQPQSARVAFIDCDSYQVQTAGRSFPCAVLTPDFSPPELLRTGGTRPQLLPEHVHFSAAVLFFMIFTCGGHPYSIANGGNPVENILAGRHFLGGRGVATGWTTPAIWARYQSLSPWVKRLFKDAFIDGHAAPDARPDFRAWAEAVTAFARQLEAARSAPAA